MNGSKSTLGLGILLITTGTGWLLSAMDFLPTINWLWTLGLAVTGLTAFAMMGIDKVSAVVGPFFLVTALLSVLRQTEHISLNHEVPILVITSGVLLLISRLPQIPTPKWIVEVPTSN